MHRKSAARKLSERFALVEFEDASDRDADWQGRIGIFLEAYRDDH